MVAFLVVPPCGTLIPAKIALAVSSQSSGKTGTAELRTSGESGRGRLARVLGGLALALPDLINLRFLSLSLAGMLTYVQYQAINEWGVTMLLSVVGCSTVEAAGIIMWFGIGSVVGAAFSGELVGMVSNPNTLTSRIFIFFRTGALNGNNAMANAPSPSSTPTASAEAQVSMLAALVTPLTALGVLLAASSSSLGAAAGQASTASLSLFLFCYGLVLSIPKTLVGIMVRADVQRIESCGDANSTGMAPTAGTVAGVFGFTGQLAVLLAGYPLVSSLPVLDAWRPNSPRLLASPSTELEGWTSLLWVLVACSVANVVVYAFYVSRSRQKQQPHNKPACD